MCIYASLLYILTKSESFALKCSPIRMLWGMRLRWSIWWEWRNAIPLQTSRICMHACMIVHSHHMYSTCTPSFLLLSYQLTIPSLVFQSRGILVTCRTEWRLPLLISSFRMTHSWKSMSTQAPINCTTQGLWSWLEGSTQKYSFLVIILLL